MQKELLCTSRNLYNYIAYILYNAIINLIFAYNLRRERSYITFHSCVFLNLIFYIQNNHRKSFKYGWQHKYFYKKQKLLLPYCQVL